ncbi:hypothetical protein BAUCODRAFT_29906 [Baudoinia panamericana UAMH 10762]|uniref:Uncharacterized protein n=1 Tax=Baudoinia panamericana (strain UAMH 10762) TaxID=717646 RepID=M2NKB6_BAUPA|nr:uncharacterized protein BAUCODRAFT_29906 [Baudoinia panamericana UAMH 10762]EMC99550.1 hypothetical protein BAUCODRAFT_29906 [Baudoinia panamericana UAMH 10762]
MENLIATPKPFPDQLGVAKEAISAIRPDDCSMSRGLGKEVVKLICQWYGGYCSSRS